MNGRFPTTPLTLLTRLREPGNGHYWEVSWKRFLELYQEPLTVTARAIRDRAVVHSSDVLAEPDYETKDAALAAGFRGSLGVPMLR